MFNLTCSHKVMMNYRTDIKWKKGKDVTRKERRRKQRREDGSGSRIITETIRADSFFNFFESPKADDEVVSFELLISH